MGFEVLVLGASSASFAYGRHHSAQLVLHEGNPQYLVDCGEGTQLQMLKYGVRKNKLKHIFISHLHGDHYLGLVGLISTMSLQGRRQELNIYGPSGLAGAITDHLRRSGSTLQFSCLFHPLEPSQEPTVIVDASDHQVSSFSVQHSLQCWGFRFQEKPKKRRLVKENLPAGLQPAQIGALRSGKDVTLQDGTLLRNELCTLPPAHAASYAYCTDTAVFAGQAELVRGVDLLYHEATFPEELLDRAAQTGHSTARQAAKLAAEAQVHQLVLGHFSARYRDLGVFLDEAQAVFPNSVLAKEGRRYSTVGS